MARFRRVRWVAPLVLVFLFGVAGQAGKPPGLAGNEVRDSPFSEPSRPLIVEEVDNVPWRRDATTAPGDFAQDPIIGGIDVLIPPPDGPPDGDVAFVELDKGSLSYYRAGDMEFGGGCLAVRDGETWQQFWSVHMFGEWPNPPAPRVDFSVELVMACLHGWWRDCCTAHVEIVGVRSEGGAYRVSVHRHDWDGLMHSITNPYHFATAPRTNGSVQFFDDYTGQRIPDLPPVP